MRKTALLFLLLAAAACKKGNDEQTAPAPTTATDSSGQPAQIAPVYPEPEALQILRVVDSARIASAIAIRDLSQNESVLEYARVMLADHRAIGALLDSTLSANQQTPADNATSNELRASGQQFVTELLARDSGVNNAYIQHEIDDHQRALQLMDTELIPSARSPETKTLLERLRPAFEAHLQRAQTILANRRAAAARAAAAPRPVPTYVDTVTTTTTNM